MPGRIFRLALSLLVAMLVSCTDSCTPDMDFLQPTVMDVLLVHTPDMQERYGIDVEEGEVTAIKVFLYQFQLDDSEQSQVSGATVRAVMPNGQAVLLQETSPGWYEAMSTEEPAIYYEEDGLYGLVAIVDGTEFAAEARANVGTEILAPENGSEVEAGETLLVQVQDESDAQLLLIYNDDGEEVYSNLPQDSDSLTDLLMDTDGSSEEIPGELLADEDIFLIGTTAMEKATWETRSAALNSALSLFLSGSLEVVAVSTGPLEAMKGLLLQVSGETLSEYGIDVEDTLYTGVYCASIDVDDQLLLNPIEAAGVDLSWPGGQVALGESTETAGLYEADLDQAPSLSYQDGAWYTVTLNADGESYDMTIQAPSVPQIPGLESGDYHEPNTALEITTPDTHDLYFAVVVDQSGSILFSDIPDTEDVESLVDGEFGTGPGEVITIPAGIFNHSDFFYGIGLLGLVRSDQDSTSDNLNSELSGMYAGATGFVVLTTLETPL